MALRGRWWQQCTKGYPKRNNTLNYCTPTNCSKAFYITRWNYWWSSILKWATPLTKSKPIPLYIPLSNSSKDISRKTLSTANFQNQSLSYSQRYKFCNSRGTLFKLNMLFFLREASSWLDNSKIRKNRSCKKLLSKLRYLMIKLKR